MQKVRNTSDGKNLGVGHGSYKPLLPTTPKVTLHHRYDDCFFMLLQHLLLFLLGVIATLILLLGGLGLLPPDTTWASTTKWRGESEVDVLLGVETDDERWDVDDLLANAV